MRDGVKGDCTEEPGNRGLGLVSSRAFLITLILSLNVCSGVLVNESKAEVAAAEVAEVTESISVRGGGLVIMEQATATWCET